MQRVKVNREVVWGRERGREIVERERETERESERERLSRERARDGRERERERAGWARERERASDGRESERWSRDTVEINVVWAAYLRRSPYIVFSKRGSHYNGPWGADGGPLSLTPHYQRHRAAPWRTGFSVNSGETHRAQAPLSAGPLLCSVWGCHQPGRGFLMGCTITVTGLYREGEWRSEW